MTKLFNTLDKVKLTIYTIEAIFGVLGASLILTEEHPYLALISLAIARTSTKWEALLKSKEKETINNKNQK